MPQLVRGPGVVAHQPGARPNRPEHLLFQVKMASSSYGMYVTSYVINSKEVTLGCSHQPQGAAQFAIISPSLTAAPGTQSGLK